MNSTSGPVQWTLLNPIEDYGLSFSFIFFLFVYVAKLRRQVWTILQTPKLKILNMLVWIFFITIWFWNT